MTLKMFVHFHPQGVGISAFSNNLRYLFARRFYLCDQLVIYKMIYNFRGQTSLDGAGVGQERPAELTQDDSEFDAFRKRMMLAYRFRPNPLVCIMYYFIPVNWVTVVLGLVKHGLEQ